MEDRVIELPLSFFMKLSEADAKCRAIEAIIKTEDFRIEREKLAVILGVELPAKRGGNNGTDTGL